LAEGIELKVAEALLNDVGRGIARIDSKSRELLNVKSGDYIEIKGKKVSVCGEMASDPLGLRLLLSLGIDSLSVPMRMFLKIKQEIRNINYENLLSLSTKILNSSSSDEIIEILESTNYVN